MPKTDLRTADQHAAHELVLSCRRMIRAVRASVDNDNETLQPRAEAARVDTIKKMVRLLQEYGLCDVANSLERELIHFRDNGIDD